MIRQIDKITAETGGDVHNGFTDLTESYQVAHIKGQRQK